MIEAKEVERERAKTLYLRGRISLEETETHLGSIAADIDRLRGQLAALQAHAFEAQVADAEHC
jgi:hypothetical protein